MCVTYKTNTAVASTVAIQTRRGSVVLFTASSFSPRKSTAGQCVCGRLVSSPTVSVVPDDLTCQILLKFRRPTQNSPGSSAAAPGEWNLETRSPVVTPGASVIQMIAAYGLPDGGRSEMSSKFVSSPDRHSDLFKTTTEQVDSLDNLSINTIRTLSIDAVQQAKSGHPGTPMALAPVIYTLWQRFLRFDPDS